MNIAAFLGDGIGPEVVRGALGVLEIVNDAMSLDIRVAAYPCGLQALEDVGTTFPEESRLAATTADGIILGPLSTSDYAQHGASGINASAVLRLELDLFANIRPSRTPHGVTAACPGMDLVFVRENTEGFYAVRTMHAGSGEFAPDSDSAFAIRKITASASRRIAEKAFALARRRRGKVTAVNKSNVLKISDGLFLRECRVVAAENPEIIYDEELVDAVASKLVRDRGDYDVVVTTNLFGDILSNEAAELSGGLGLSGSLNHGDRHAMAQASHGSAPDIAGTGAANPASMILSLALLLDHLGQEHARPDMVAAARHVDGALRASLLNPATRTFDLGGSADTDTALHAIAVHLRTAIDNGS